MHAIRLQPGSDLYQSLSDFCSKNNILAGYLGSAVGSLNHLTIRLADSVTILDLHQHFELLTLSGTLSTNGIHLHVSVADEQGNVIGGHLLTGCMVRTTMEIIIIPVDQLCFERVYDEQTGYRELVIKHL
jgi:uncharacterized protein